MENTNPRWAWIRGLLLLYRSLLGKLEPGSPTLKLSRLLFARAAIVRAGKWLPWPDLYSPCLPLVLSALLLWSDYMLLCGVTNARSKEPGVYLTVCACVQLCAVVCAHKRMLCATNHHSGDWLANMKMSQFHGLQRPEIPPTHTSYRSMQMVWFVIVYKKVTVCHNAVVLIYMHVRTLG